MTLKIAFASCMDAERDSEQRVWFELAKRNPTALLLLGDQIYMDWGLASLANLPAIKKVLRKDPERAKEAFADEMYARYRAQWMVRSFQQVVGGIDPDAVLMTWDDHDFAWNNAYGAGAGVDDDDDVDKNVPESLKSISYWLRRQFEAELRRRPLSGEYPGRPSMTALQAAPPASIPPQTVTLQGIEVLLLDQRWQRTQRDLPPGQRRLLSDADRQLLTQKVATPSGLLILAGCAPLKHQSIFGTHDAWWARHDDKKSPLPGSRAYVEYQQLVDAAAESSRPVLYLAGDVHRNAYGGPVESDSTVVQVLSSGAALGRLLFHEFPGAFGLLHIEGTAKDATVEIELTTLNKKGAGNRKLQVAGGKWKTPLLEGECTNPQLATDPAEELGQALASRPISVLCYRERGDRCYHEDELPAVDIDALNIDVFVDRLPYVQNGVPGWGLRDMPEPVTVSSAYPRIAIKRHRGGQSQAERVGQMISDVFGMAMDVDQAAGQHYKPVVFFVHGFNKSFAASVQQACELRDRFDCIPLLYSWPTGAEGGLFSIVGAYTMAAKVADANVKGLAGVLSAFCDLAGRVPQVPAVLVTRSLGAEALDALPYDQHINIDSKALRRVILSAPACSDAPDMLQWLKCETVVTVNRNDRTLKYADWLHKGRLLGNAPIQPRNPSTVFLDCTDITGVDLAHDYFFPRLNHDLHDLNRQLVGGLPINYPALGIAGLKVHHRGQVFGW